MHALVILPVLASMLTGILSAARSTSPTGTDLQGNSSSSDLPHHRVGMTDKRSATKQRTFDGNPTAQKGVRRRSVNLPDPDKPKFNRLLKVHRNRFLEVNEDGDVLTTTDSNSMHSKLEVQFMCYAFPERFRNCGPSPPILSEDATRLSVYSFVLLRFIKTNRYLCMNETAAIYTKYAKEDKVSLDVSDCVFEHEFLPNMYDVYSSLKYPRNSTRCRLAADPTASASAAAGAATSAGAAGGKHRRRRRRRDRRFCEMRWFVGVNRDAEVVAIRSSKTPNSKAFFIQRWANDQPRQTGPTFKHNPYRDAKLTGRSSSSSSHYSAAAAAANSPNASSSSSVTNSSTSVGSRTRPRKPIYRFLTKLTSGRNRQTSSSSSVNTSTECRNLLKNCDETNHSPTIQQNGKLSQNKKRKRPHQV